MTHHDAAEADKRTILYPPEELSKNAYIKSMDEYREMHRRSIEEGDSFWSEMAETLDWYRKWDSVHTWDPQECECTWFEGGKLNVSYNCLDRHVNSGKADRVAIIWEPDEPGEGRTYTYGQLLDEVCRFANVLKKHGVKKGDRVCIYLPMIPELPIAMLACARIGAIHSVVFGGFSSDALRDRILDSDCKALICADAGFRSGKTVPLKKNADASLEECPSIENVFVVKHSGADVEMTGGRDYWWHEETAAADISPQCAPEEMDSEDPLFILYTSGSTGKPKGVLHTTAGYLLHTSLSLKWIFDIHDNDIWWCTADIGWVTGHSYIVYGPLANGFTEVMFEGVPTYPEPDRFWKVVEKHKVTVFYTAPTVIRSLMREGEDWTKTADLSSLRVLGTVGEPINPEVWLWYYDHIGKERCPIMDTWWQTETGGILITPLAGATPMKPGSASFPFFGVDPVILNQDGKEVATDESGFLCIRRPWPGMMRTVYGNHELFINTYWTMFPGLYVTGDGCRVDADGFYWLQGRIDDVINVSGHRIGTAEVESALVSHEYISEAAVVGMPHDIKGQGIYAYVTLKAEYERLDEDEVRKALVAHTRKEIGPIATPDVIHFTPSLPKTRSGKIMRRILRKIAEGTSDTLGDTSTLADPSVVDALIEGNRQLTD
ncbi:MAG: acetate--CoA ligase [Actinobacteria bacterium]|jgi:acetyl-CoA synthetase|nr:MAG: acetate--CoA ligase [Actinomycetota bacterium]